MPERPRRLRRGAVIRGMMQETHLHPQDFIMPVFVKAGSNSVTDIASMPGIRQWTLDRVGEEISRIQDAGISQVILFGIPESKDACGSDAISDEGIIQKAVRTIKKNFPDMYVITDVCMCEYTDHGHCGILEDGDVNNEKTLPYLGQQAVTHARAGADMVAPSGMMDGMVGAIRGALDEAGFSEIPIMSYSVKYASAYYGPFRDAAESAPKSGDRKSYQMQPANAREGLREARLDVDEGADMLMVKPALAYLDMIYRLKERFDLPVACYNVSGEYSMIKAAAEKGWIDEKAVMMETLLSMKRAGADVIITYFAVDAALLLRAKY